jgi:hypothetical protein
MKMHSRVAPTPSPEVRAPIGQEIPSRKNQSGRALISGNATTCRHTPAGGASISIVLATANSFDVGTRDSRAASVGNML